MPGGLTGRKNWEHSLLYMGEIGLPFAVHFTGIKLSAIELSF